MSESPGLVREVLGLEPLRWEDVGPHRFWGGAATVFGAWMLVSLNRFGGLIIEAPRGFLRMAVVGVWGWIALSLALWLVWRLRPGSAGADDAGDPRAGGSHQAAALETEREAAPGSGRVGQQRIRAGYTHPTTAESPSVLTAMGVVGQAHRPVILFAVVILIATGFFELGGPGLVAAVVAFGLWMPAMLFGVSRYRFGLGLVPGLVAVAVPYLIWLLTIGRYFINQVSHLL